MINNNEIETLKEFMNYPIKSSDAILERFAKLPGAVMKGEAPARFVYVPGTRHKKVLLVAHADTVWTDDSIFKVVYKEDGNGADDRAGCAILWLLKDTGHSLLITDGEEIDSKGTEFLKKNAELFDEINRDHHFMIEFDHGKDGIFKCYDVGSEGFRKYVKEMMPGFVEPDKFNKTDICDLCRDICGVNLSVGYYKEHTPSERIEFGEWQKTLHMTRRWLSERHFPRFKPKAVIVPVDLKKLAEMEALVEMLEHS